MKLATQTNGVRLRLGELRGIRLLCESGFDALDYSMFHMKDRDESSKALNGPQYREYAKDLLRITGEYGISFCQSHAPFPSQREKDTLYNEKMMDILKRSIEFAGLLDAGIIVIHPSYYKHRAFLKNMEFFLKLEPYARDYGVKIAIENTWVCDKKGRIIPDIFCSLSGEFKKAMDALDNKYFTACIDVGHSGLVGEYADKLIREMGARTGCYHIQDNNGREDLHTLPYTSGLNWDLILKAIAETGYEGAFTLEADNFFINLPDAAIPAALKLMEITGRSMIERINDFRINGDKDE
jgi:sugar phosphate isomerase/epimerase